MLYRSSKITHPSGISVETPLLVPSFSSKGFTFNKDGVSEATEALQVSKEFLTECLLISAYDLFHKHIPYTDDILPTEITIIDSGGYETSDVYDFSANAKYSYPVKDWGQFKYETMIDQWPAHKAGIIVSYDHGHERNSLEDQIKNANALFVKYPGFLSDFLIKPEKESQRYIQIENILKKIDMITGFSIIGVTEKELGNSILDRMLNVAKIRRALDSNNITSPIHVFGSLDPVTSILYFLAGAEIFDGLTWLKYSYFKGTAIYQSNYGAMSNDLGIHVRDVQVRVKSIVNNIYYLDRIKYIIKNFVVANDFTLFNELDPDMGNSLSKFYKSFESNLK